MLEEERKTVYNRQLADSVSYLLRAIGAQNHDLQQATFATKDCTLEVLGVRCEGAQPTESAHRIRQHFKLLAMLSERGSTKKNLKQLHQLLRVFENGSMATERKNVQ